MADTSDRDVAQHAATAEPASGRMPIELVTMVMEYLLEYGLDPHGEPPLESETIKDGQTQEMDEEISWRWRTFSTNSSSSILNARLTCRAFYNGSDHAFAKILGD
jgi:hypothetical protein